MVTVLFNSFFMGRQEFAGKILYIRMLIPYDDLQDPLLNLQVDNGLVK